MVDLTVIILTKNEEKNLRKCVESFRGIAKRFVIVDSFSTDTTEELCKKLNSELQKIGSSLDFYQNKWVDYATQLNWGLTQTNITTEWSMRMDADEELMENLAQEIDEKLANIQSRQSEYEGRQIIFTPNAFKAMSMALETAKELGSSVVLPEHIVLGMLKTKRGIAYDILKELKIHTNDLAHSMTQPSLTIS